MNKESHNIGESAYIYISMDCVDIESTAFGKYAYANLNLYTHTYI